ncbi:MAG: Maf family protein [Terriglobia bacterium]
MLILASSSPRRSELLKAAGFDFTVRAASIDESVLDGENPDAYVLRVATAKARAVSWSPGEIILAADTTVAVGGQILGKPSGDNDAVSMLTALSGRRHDVVTGVCLRENDRLLQECFSTAVWFAPLSDEEIRWYVASGEPMDKAGAYGIQGLAARFVERIDGSYSNVVGLPVAPVYRLLAEFAR